MTHVRLSGALRSTQAPDPAAISALISEVGADLEPSDVVVYLVDFAQNTLEPMPSHRPGATSLESEAVATTMAGRSFVDQDLVWAERPEGTRVWVPIVEGSDRTGVLALTVPTLSDDAARTCAELGIFAGYLIAAQTRYTDLYSVHRRRRPLSLAASMQWDLLPPLVLKTDRLTVAALVEPAYDVGGDCFDYALNGPILDLAVIDPMGHGSSSPLVAAVAVGSYRHDRRNGLDLEHVHANLDAAVETQFGGTFATGQLARIDLTSGVLRWTNAGHPHPLLIRGGSVVRELRSAPSLPWGIGGLIDDRPATTVASEALEPGDSVLFYTDGVTEAHVPGGDRFGFDRLADLASQHASDQLEPEEIVRRIIRKVLEHQSDTLRDDATVVLFRWNGSGDGATSG